MGDAAGFVNGKEVNGLIITSVMVPYREAYRPTVFDYNHTKEENGKNA